MSLYANSMCVQEAVILALRAPLEPVPPAHKKCHLVSTTTLDWLSTLMWPLQSLVSPSLHSSHPLSTFYEPLWSVQTFEHLTRFGRRSAWESFSMNNLPYTFCLPIICCSGTIKTGASDSKSEWSVVTDTTIYHNIRYVSPEGLSPLLAVPLMNCCHHSLTHLQSGQHVWA